MSTIAEAIDSSKVNTAVIQDQLKEKDDKYKDWTYVTHNGRNIPFKKAQSIHTVWDRTMQHQKGHMWTGILLIGQSGSGKTTLVNGLIHYLHTNGKEYEIHRMSGDEINNMDKVIDKLTVGKKHLMFFDDASYSLGNLNAKQVDALKASLPTIRHKVQANVIGVFATHYTKALDKFFRSQAVMIFTSTSATEKSNLYELFRKDMNKISVFGKVYTKATFYGYWDQTVDMFDGEVIRYTFSEPFRPVLVAFGDEVRACLVRVEECEVCNPPPDFKGKLKGFDPRQMQENPEESVNKLLETVLDRGLGLERIRLCIALHLWLKHDDQKLLPSKEKTLINFFRSMENYIDIPKSYWYAVIDEIKGRKLARNETFKQLMDEENVSPEEREKRYRENYNKLQQEYRDKKMIQKERRKKYTQAKKGFGHGKDGILDKPTDSTMEKIEELKDE